MIKREQKEKSREASSRQLHKVSISSIKQGLEDVSYLSDDLIITPLTVAKNITINYPATIDGFAALITMCGAATISIDMKSYEVRPNMIVFFNPNSIIKTTYSSDDAFAYLVAFSKSFVNDIQIDLSTSIPIYMRFGQEPILKVTSGDVAEIRQLFQLIRTMLESDKGRYRQEIIRTLFTTMFYIITDINQRDRRSETMQTKGRAEVLFDSFLDLLQKHSKQERNVVFYSSKLNITPKYLSTVVKDMSGKTAAKWIDESVILEAKTLLKFSGKSIQEIAYHLNFNTQSFFGKYFKQHTGYSPSRYKHNG